MAWIGCKTVGAGGAWVGSAVTPGIARWEASGESAAVFASRSGTSTSTLYRWQRELRKATGLEKAESALAKIVEVRPTRVSTADDRFEVRLLDGRSVVVPPSFDADALTGLLHVLEAAR